MDPLIIETVKELREGLIDVVKNKDLLITLFDNL
jgi:hypothetical protein